MAQATEMHAAVGQYLSVWARVETELYFAFLALSPFTADPHAMAKIFGALDNVRVKSKVVDALAKHSLEGSPLLDQWTAMKKAVKRESDERNKIAHYAIYTHKDASFLADHIVIPAKDGDEFMPPDDALGVEQVRELIEKASTLAATLKDLRKRIRGYREQQLSR